MSTTKMTIAFIHSIKSDYYPSKQRNGYLWNASTCTILDPLLCNQILRGPFFYIFWRGAEKSKCKHPTDMKHSSTSISLFTNPSDLCRPKWRDLIEMRAVGSVHQKVACTVTYHGYFLSQWGWLCKFCMQAKVNQAYQNNFREIRLDPEGDF